MSKTNSEVAAAVAHRRATRTTGSEGALVHSFTDGHLREIVANERVAREAAWLYYAADRVVRAAELELVWREETGVRFGWTAR